MVRELATLKADDADDGDMRRAVDAFTQRFSEVFAVDRETLAALIWGDRWFPPKEAVTAAYSAGKWLRMFANKIHKQTPLTFTAQRKSA